MDSILPVSYTHLEIWRHEWEVIQNRYLEANDRPERVDLRSYARQGLDIIPVSYTHLPIPAFRSIFPAYHAGLRYWHFRLAGHRPLTACLLYTSRCV